MIYFSQMQTYWLNQELAQPQLQHNLNTVVGLDTKMTLHTPPHTTTETQLYPLENLDSHLLTTTKYNVTKKAGPQQQDSQQ